MEVSLAAAVPVAEVVITPAGRGEVSKPVAVTAGGRIVILATPIHVQALAWRRKEQRTKSKDKKAKRKRQRKESKGKKPRKKAKKKSKEKSREKKQRRKAKRKKAEKKSKEKKKKIKNIQHRGFPNGHPPLSSNLNQRKFWLNPQV